MNKKDEALRMAIEALEYEEFCSDFLRVEAINACKAALDTEQVREGVVPEQEPVYIVGQGWQVDKELQVGTTLYTRPTKPLSDDEIWEIANKLSRENWDYLVGIARAIEKAHGIGND